MIVTGRCRLRSKDDRIVYGRCYDSCEVYLLGILGLIPELSIGVVQRELNFVMADNGGAWRPAETERKFGDDKDAFRFC